MPLIECIHAANYIHSDKEEDGNIRFLDRPKCYDWLLNFECQNGLGVVPNGFGKSGVIDACYAALSQDKDLFSSAKARMAPKGIKPSHIRIEFVIPKRQFAGTKGGIEQMRKTARRHVIGMFGFRDSDVSLYSYSGPLSDLPVYSDKENHVYMGYYDFLDVLEEKGAVVVSGRSNERIWKVEISDKLQLSRESLEQLVRYQNEGGDDKAASLFDFEEKPGEDLHHSFFYQKIAPELLRKIVVESGTDTKKNMDFNEAIHLYGDAHSKLVADNIRTKRSLEALGSDISLLGNIRTVACRLEGLKRLNKKARKRLGGIFAAYEALCTEGILPGMPTWVPSGDPEIDILTSHMLVREKGEPLLAIRGLVRLLEQDSSAFSDVKNFALKGLPLSQLAKFIVFSTNFKNVLPDYAVRGRAATEQEWIAALQPIDSPKEFLNGREPTEIAEVISKAFDYARKNIWHDPARHNSMRMREEFKSWEDATESKMRLREDRIEKQIKQLEDSPEKRGREELAELISECKDSVSSWVNLDDVKALRSILETYSQFGSTASQINSTHSELKERYKRERPLYLALKECGRLKQPDQSVEDFLNRRLDILRRIDWWTTLIAVQKRDKIESQTKSIKSGQVHVPEEANMFLSQLSAVEFETLAAWSERVLVDSEERRRCTTLFSSVLHCPVFHNLADAKKGAQIVAQKGFRGIPVFWSEGLKQILSDLSEDQESKTVHYHPMVGSETEQVCALLDPALSVSMIGKLERRLNKIDAASKCLKKLKGKLEYIEGKKVQDILDEKSLLEGFPKLKEQISLFDNQEKSVESMLRRAVSCEESLAERGKDLDVVEGVFDFISEAKEVQRFLSAKADGTQRDTELHKKIGRYRKAKRQLSNFQKDREGWKLFKEARKAPVVKAENEYESYFSELSSLQKSYFKLKKAERKKGNQLQKTLSYKTDAASDRVGQMAKIVSDLYHGHNDKMTQAEIAVSNIVAYLKSRLICQDKFRRVEKNRRLERGSNLFKISASLESEIDSRFDVLKLELETFQDNKSKVFPKGTLNKVISHVNNQSFHGLTTEMNAIRSKIAEAIEGHRLSSEDRGSARQSLIRQLATFAKRGIHHLNIFRTVCRTTENTIEIDVTAAALDRVESIITDMVDGFEKAAEEENKKASFETIKDNFLKAIYRDPKVSIKHSSIHSNGSKFSFDKKVSTGEKTAIGLLILTKLKEFAHERDRRSNRQIHGDFVIVDGLFSNCSKEDLWKGALGSLKESHGSFQMIGFLHDVSFINDFGIFPVIFVGEREQGDDSTENSSSEWYTVYQAQSMQDIRFAKGYEKQAVGADEGEGAA